MTINICIAGLGNVGSEVVRSLSINNNYINKKLDIKINIIGISAKNKTKKRSFNIDEFNWYSNPEDLLELNNIDIFIELIGEEKGLSYELVKKALNKNINVITANKALLSKHGNELFKIAENNKILLLFEAAVCGGIPIIKVLKESILFNKFNKISGILNGTTNFILTQMEKNNQNYNDVLIDAQKNGFAESNPTNDIEGIDSAHKLSLLAAICFGVKINFKNINYKGISKIHIDDIKNAKKLGYKIKLISTSQIKNNKIINVVEPTLVHLSNKLANVDGVLNGIQIKSDYLESLFLEGEGAGGKATANSIISDIVEIYHKSKNYSLGHSIDNLIDFEPDIYEDRISSFYLRIQVKDTPGVLAKITSFLNEENISIETILQIPENINGKINEIPVIITTYETTYKLLNNAISKMENLDFVTSDIAVINIDKNIE